MTLSRQLTVHVMRLKECAEELRDRIKDYKQISAALQVFKSTWPPND